MKTQSMIFEKGHLFHIYNQGNNRQKLFYNQENYLFFLKKINTYILPYADVLAWCLMPNHFHLMVLVNDIEIIQKHEYSPGESIRNGYNHPVNTKARSFNNSISILLRSYTRAINKQENRSGSLFREATKAECINCFKGTKTFFIQSSISLTNLLLEKQYPQVCFNYIHQNPVKSGLVKNTIDWEFSSAKDYAGLRNGKLISKAIAAEYIDF